MDASSLLRQQPFFIIIVYESALRFRISSLLFYMFLKLRKKKLRTVSFLFTGPKIIYIFLEPRNFVDDFSLASLGMQFWELNRQNRKPEFFI